ncbi:S8 family peptidase [Flavobacteriales bacterium]|nr:S8 family peptidase [Flavobacteriales bacterium]
MISKALLFILILGCGITGLSQKKFEGNFYLQKYLLENSTSSEKVGLFVKGNLSQVQNITKQHNGIYRGSVKGWYYVRIPSNELQEFVENKNILNVNFRAYKGRALNDTMRVNNRINDIHTGTAPLNTSLEGDGVIIGFIDTGIDFLHPDFMNPDSSTRVMALWDQSLGVNQYTPAQYGYGQHWDSTQINQGLSTNNDIYGHGSMVAGTACGNAFANGKNKGVAPKADIIMVETNEGAADWLATVADAVEYIYTIADSIGKPCVINASVGEYYGSHDGLDPYALYIDSLINAKKGHLFVAAAGNSGALGPYHLHTEVTDTSMTWFKLNPSSAFGVPTVFFEVWADTADLNNINFSIGADKVSPMHSFRGRGQFFNAGSMPLSTLTFDTIRNTNADILGTIMYWIESRDGQYLLQAYMQEPDSAQYHFRFETAGTGSFDVWTTATFGTSDMENRADTIVGFTEINKYVYPDTLQTICSSFQCSPNVITVGNYANDSGYVNKYSDWIPNGETRGKLAANSSKGPTRNGLIKPEIAASGAGTNSALPLFRIAQLDATLALGGMHYRNGGTSMSSPVVAGVAALFLEQCPQRGASDFNTALINAAYTDSFTGAVPNNAFGYGKLDGFATLINGKEIATYSGNSIICEGDSTQLSITSTNVSYLWESGSTANSHYFSDSVDTYFIVTNLTTGCVSDTMNITTSVAEKPIATFSGNSLICAGDSTQLSITSTSVSYLWESGNITDSQYFSDSVNTYFIVTDLTTECVSDTNHITTSVAEKPTLECLTNTYDFCENTSITITESGVFNSVLWNDGLTINPRVFSQAYDGYILGLDNNSCKSDTCFITITEQPSPIATYSGNSIICAGDSTQLSITSTNVSYLWKSGNIADSQYFSDSVNTYFIVTDLTTECVSDTNHITTSIAEKPTLECLTNTYDFCESDSVTITENGVFNSVLWNDGLTINPRVFSQAYDGYILGLDTNSCKSDTCFVTVTEQPNPAQATITNNNTVLSTSSGYTSYQWYLDGVLLTGANDSVYAALLNGNYQVEVFNSFGCSTFSSITTITNVGINEHTINGIIYPNPNNGTFTIETNQNNVTLSLYSSLGKLISTKYSTNSKIHTYQNLATGTYFLLLSDDLQVVYKKIVVLK